MLRARGGRLFAVVHSADGHNVQSSENPFSTQDSGHDGGRFMALNRRSRTRRDGLYRTLGTYLTSDTAAAVSERRPQKRAGPALG